MGQIGQRVRVAVVGPLGGLHGGEAYSRRVDPRPVDGGPVRVLIGSDVHAPLGALGGGRRSQAGHLPPRARPCGRAGELPQQLRRVGGAHIEMIRCPGGVTGGRRGGPEPGQRQAGCGTAGIRPEAARWRKHANSPEVPAGRPAIPPQARCPLPNRSCGNIQGQITHLGVRIAVPRVAMPLPASYAARSPGTRAPHPRRSGCCRPRRRSQRRVPGRGPQPWPSRHWRRPSHRASCVTRRKTNRRHMIGDHHRQSPGGQLCWSEPWMRFSARTAAGGVW